MSLRRTIENRSVQRLVPTECKFAMEESKKGETEEESKSRTIAIKKLTRIDDETGRRSLGFPLERLFFQRTPLLHFYRSKGHAEKNCAVLMLLDSYVLCPFEQIHFSFTSFPIRKESFEKIPLILDHSLSKVTSLSKHARQDRRRSLIGAMSDPGQVRDSPRVELVDYYLGRM